MLEPGQTFASRYRIVKMLAPGGMGAVFEAEHTGTEQRVALKVLWPQILAVASAREKFELEAKIAARVKSEHIVQVLDAGFDEATRSPYLVMELLTGGTLTARVNGQGPMASGEAVTVLRQVARGLDAAHGFRDAKGALTPIIHRDLKPDNLILSSRADGSQLVKILDFGIAKVLSESRNMSREVRGTPEYMAFEQVMAGALSPQTDIWALGLIAYFLLTGRRYWRTADDPNAGLQALFAEIMSLPLEPASVRMQQQGVGARLPPEFDAWLLKCIDRDPAQRFASSGAAVDALERALQGSVRSLAPSLAYAAAERAQPARSAGREVRAAQSSTAASLPALESQDFQPIQRARSSVRRTALTMASVALFSVAAASLWLLRAKTQPIAGEPAPAPATAATSPAAPAAPTSPIGKPAVEIVSTHDPRPVPRVQIVPSPRASEPPPAIEPAPARPKAKSSRQKPEATRPAKLKGKAAQSATPEAPKPRALATPPNPFDVR